MKFNSVVDKPVPRSVHQTEVKTIVNLASYHFFSDKKALNFFVTDETIPKQEII